MQLEVEVEVEAAAAEVEVEVEAAGVEVEVEVGVWCRSCCASRSRLALPNTHARPHSSSYHCVAQHKTTGRQRVRGEGRWLHVDE